MTRAVIPMLALLSAAVPLAAQRTHLLIVTGLAGEPHYAARFAETASALHDAARRQWGVDSADLVYLAERPDADPTRMRGRATRDAILMALRDFAGRAAADDVVFLVMLGHGSQQGTEARFSLPGPDLSAADLAGALAAFTRPVVVVVNAASASGDFLAPLSGPRRVIVTATKSGFERNATLFGDHFVRGLVSGEADADKDGRVSIAEAYAFARREVARAYEAERRLLTEHAQLDDNGDGRGSGALDQAATDGALARAVAFALQPTPVLADERAAPLLAERRRLETLVAELRQRKTSLDSTAYERELERLLVKLAETNRALRALEQPR